MSLRERLAVAPVNPVGQFCLVGRMLKNLDTLAAGDSNAREEYEALARTLCSSAWSAVDIQRALVAEGYSVSLKHIREHRRGDHTEQQCAAHEVGLL